MELDDFVRHMAESGYTVFKSVVPEDLLARLRADIPRRIAVCEQWQRRIGNGDSMGGVAHHVVGGDDSLTDFLRDLPLDREISAHFGAPYILNSYGAVNNRPEDKAGYAHGLRFHRDVRTYSRDFPLMLNMLVMVHAFTPDNGATRVVPGSHRSDARPDEHDMLTHCEYVTGPAGSILLFDSNLWHAASHNRTQSDRMALTLTFTRAFHKQQLDYPELLGENYTQDEKLRQLLGYNARVPRNYDEWYQPAERRRYKPGQG